MCLTTTYHEDVDEVAGGGVPHLQRQIVGCCDHCAVMAIPCYHGNLQLGHFVFQRRRVVLPEEKMLIDGCHVKVSLVHVIHKNYIKEQIKDIL